jgi:integrase
MELTAPAPQAGLFGDYAKQWLAQYVTVACKPSSGRILRGIVRNHLWPAFGAQGLQSITRTQIKTFVAQEHQRYRPKYVRDLVRTLHIICAHAVDEEILDRNPATKLGRYLPEQRSTPPRETNPLTRAELTRYLATMREAYPQPYPYFLCLARTGMREEEALRLHYEHHAPIQSVSEQLEHASIKITVDTYGHPRQGTSIALADCLDTQEGHTR